MPKKKTGDRVLIQFANPEQAEAFFKWFKNYGMDALMSSDNVNDDLPQELFYNCVSANELPGATSDPEAYFIEIE